MEGTEKTQVHEASPDKSQGSTSDYVKTHCVTCAGGQTVVRNDDQQAVYCLLVREWMTDDKSGIGLIKSCNRFELRDQELDELPIG